MAQLGLAHQYGVLGVGGSNPLIPTNKKIKKCLKKKDKNYFEFLKDFVKTNINKLTN